MSMTAFSLDNPRLYRVADILFDVFAIIILRLCLLILVQSIQTVWRILPKSMRTTDRKYHSHLVPPSAAYRLPKRLQPVPRLVQRECL